MIDLRWGFGVDGVVALLLYYAEFFLYNIGKGEMCGIFSAKVLYHRIRQ
jgi:hypothetical protein